ncbi:hypothetical protein V6N12_042824 [Hibiscus sabdariffa]
MRIYGQRAQVPGPGSVIIDGGSGCCKFGWSKYACPLGRSTTFLEFGNIESPMYSRFRHFFATFYGRKQLKDAIHTVLFDMNVPAVCAVNQETLALFAARQTSEIVVNIGFQVTSVVPILNGKVMLKQNNFNFESLDTVRILKENLCYVAADYKTELLKDTRASLEVSAVGRFTLSKEHFQIGEILFQPCIAGVRATGLHQAVELCMDHCHAAELTGDDAWFKTTILSGGTGCLPGLAERLEKELSEILSPSLANGVEVVRPPHGLGQSLSATMISGCELKWRRLFRVACFYGHTFDVA